jgi:hypothetical protein
MSPFTALRTILEIKQRARWTSLISALFAAAYLSVNLLQY